MIIIFSTWTILLQFDTDSIPNQKDPSERVNTITRMIDDRNNKNNIPIGFIRNRVKVTREMLRRWISCQPGGITRVTWLALTPHIFKFKFVFSFPVDYPRVPTLALISTRIDSGIFLFFFFFQIVIGREKNKTNKL